MWVWADLLRDEKYKRVAETNVGEYWVSTVWLGLDHSMTIPGGKLIFETMVFEVGTMKNVGDPVRYSTVEAAKEGHKWIVDRLRKEVGRG